jgi:hypothetical protein
LVFRKNGPFSRLAHGRLTPASRFDVSTSRFVVKVELLSLF